MAKVKQEKRLHKVGSKIAGGVRKATSPIRNNRVWKFLRRTILRSPFRGYFVNSWRELKHVEWPNRATAWKLTFTVFMFSVIFAVFTSALDLGFEKLARQIFLK